MSRQSIAQGGVFDNVARSAIDANFVEIYDSGTALVAVDVAEAATRAAADTALSGRVTVLEGASAVKVRYAGEFCPPTLAAVGTDVAGVATTLFVNSVYIPAPVTLTGIAFLIGSVGGTDKALCALFSAAGALLANSATAGATVGTAATFQLLPFTAAYAVLKPGLYFVAVQYNGVTAKLACQSAGVHPTTSATKTFGTIGTITPPTTFTADVGPICATY